MEYMHDDVAEVRDDPLAQREAVHSGRAHVVVIAQALLDFACDRFEVGFRITGANHEKVREAGQAAHIQRNDVFGFLVGGKLRDEVD